MSRKLSKTIVHPPREVRKFDLEKEGHTVGGAAYLETPIDRKRQIRMCSERFGFLL